jgi:ATP-binding cassette subfamily B protein
MKSLKAFLKLIPYLDEVRRPLLLGIVTGIAHQIAAVAGSAAGAYLVSLALTGSPASAMTATFWLLVVLVILRAFMSYAEMWHAHKAAYGILATLRVKLYRALEAIAPNYLMNKRTGDLSATLMSDVETLEWFYAHTYGSAVVAVLVPLAVLIAIAVLIHPLVSLVLIPWLILTISIPFWFKDMADLDGQKIRESIALVNAEVIDGIQGVREILSFGYESRYLQKIKRINKALTSLQTKYGSRLGLEGALLNAAMSFGLISVLALTARLASVGAVNREWYAVALMLSIYVFTPVVAISTMARNFGLMQSSTNRVFSVLETPATVKDSVEISAPLNSPLTVAFDKVDFRYKDELPLVLKSVTFDIQSGELVALAGYSGAGKTTCANLLLRFWDVTGGKIIVGGQDVRNLTQKDLRDKIALVPQDVYLFNCSLIDNIRIGRPGASDQEAMQAAEDARIHDFIMELPDRYQTIAGERGVQLSGGQRQRIAIARALLKNAPILLMDEAVSNLDQRNEGELRFALERLKAKRITMVIAHRLSTIMSADRIVVLENGAVKQTGKHEDMIREDGAYRALISSQYSGGNVV